MSDSQWPGSNAGNNPLALPGDMDLMSFYGGLADKAKDSDASGDLDLDITKLIKRLNMNTDGKFVCKVGSESVDLPNDRAIDIVIVERYGQSILWPPGESEDSRPPVCSTGLRPISEIRDGASGLFSIEEGNQLPYACDDAEFGERRFFNCKSCYWNQWGSKPAWDDHVPEESKAKACQESRTFMVVLVKRVMSVSDAMRRGGNNNPDRKYDDLGIYVREEGFTDSVSPLGIMTFNLNMGSNRNAIVKLIELHKARAKDMPIPFGCSVFRLEVEVEVIGQLKIARCKPRWVGMLAPSDALALYGDPRSNDPSENVSVEWCEEYRNNVNRDFREVINNNDVRDKPLDTPAAKPAAAQDDGDEEGTLPGEEVDPNAGF